MPSCSSFLWACSAIPTIRSSPVTYIICLEGQKVTQCLEFFLGDTRCMAEECIRFEVSEIDRIGFACPKCRTEVVYRVGPDVPNHCPSCSENEGRTPDQSMVNVFRAYRAFSKQAKGLAVTLIAPAPRAVPVP